MNAPERHAGPASVAVECGRCCLRELCVPEGCSTDDAQAMQAVVKRRHVALRRGDHLFRAGNPFAALFAVHLGAFKTYVETADGREQVSGFQISGDFVGVDGIGHDAHACSAMALEDSDVCVLSLEDLERMGREVPALQRQFHRMLAREILRDQGIMMLLGNMSAEERVAAFLVSLARRLESRGLPAGRFHLPMSRGDIGRYLGIKPETVSRAMTRFQDEGLVRARGKHIEILDAAGLQAVLGLQHPDAPFLA